jgi:hypothetical protein
VISAFCDVLSRGYDMTFIALLVLISVVSGIIAGAIISKSAR